jgi:hypothetical protein
MNNLPGWQQLLVLLELELVLGGEDLGGEGKNKKQTKKNTKKTKTKKKKLCVWGGGRVGGVERRGGVSPQANGVSC